MEISINMFKPKPRFMSIEKALYKCNKDKFIIFSRGCYSDWRRSFFQCGLQTCEEIQETKEDQEEDSDTNEAKSGRQGGCTFFRSYISVHP